MLQASTIVFTIIWHQAPRALEEARTPGLESPLEATPHLSPEFVRGGSEAGGAGT